MGQLLVENHMKDMLFVVNVQFPSPLTFLCCKRGLFFLMFFDATSKSDMTSVDFPSSLNGLMRPFKLLCILSLPSTHGAFDKWSDFENAYNDMFSAIIFTDKSRLTKSI